jgi:hypothetical protein
MPLGTSLLPLFLDRVIPMYSHAAATKYARFTNHLPDAGLSLLGGPLTPDKIFLFQYGETNRFVLSCDINGLNLQGRMALPMPRSRVCGEVTLQLHWTI